MPIASRIALCLWFDDEAEEAARFYTSVFRQSKIGKIARYGKAGFEFHGKAPGTVMTVEFELDGLSFTALNGGPQFKFNESVSFQIICDTQEEVDYYWEKLGAGADPKSQQCGWLKDKFGVSWQVNPRILAEILAGTDAERAQRVMMSVLRMKKIVIADVMKAAG